MVDWDRVEELRSKGWDWDRIAGDPKVGFHPDASVHDPGRALRGLYHRSRRRAEAEPTPAKRPSRDAADRRWSLARIGYLAVPVVGLWFALALIAPSPVGLVVPAIPYLALVLAGVAFVLIYGLWKSEGPKWSTVYRNTLLGGVVLGLVVAGLIGLTGSLVFGCPYLPPSSSVSPAGQGWGKVPTKAWQENNLPVFFSYGSTWCPFCSASSWAELKALSEFGTVTGASLGHSSLSDVYPGTPEAVLGNVQLGPKNGHPPLLDLQILEDASGVSPNVPATQNCYQAAYVKAYSGGGIPFIALNGQYVHDGGLFSPKDLGQWNYQNSSNSLTGAQTVQNSVLSETGLPWTYVQSAAWLMMAMIAKALNYPGGVSTLASVYGWSPSTTQNVTVDYNGLS